MLTEEQRGRVIVALRRKAADRRTQASACRSSAEEALRDKCWGNWRDLMLISRELENAAMSLDQMADIVAEDPDFVAR